MKYLTLVILFFAAGIISYIEFYPTNTEECPFCSEDVIKRQCFYEDDLFWGLYNIRPYTPGHCLLIPKRHIERIDELTEAEALALHCLIKRVDQSVSHVFGTSSYLILQKNGKNVGQSVPHVHIHYIPRKANETSTLVFMAKLYFTPLQSPLKQEELTKHVMELRRNI